MKLEVKLVDVVKGDDEKDHQVMVLEFDNAFRDWICGSEGWERLTKKRLQGLINYSLQCIMEDWAQLKKESQIDIN